MTRKVTRTWITKSGVVKTKIYTYTGKGKSRRGLTLVGKNGVINDKNIDKFKKQINDDASLSVIEKRGILTALDIKLKQIGKKKQKDRKKVTTTGFMGEFEQDNISKMLTGAGYSVEEASQELGVSEADILNTSNWHNGQFTAGGKTWDVKFTYTGSLFKEA